MSIHRSVKFPKPPASPTPGNPIVLCVLLALVLVACYVVANWNAVFEFLSQK